MNEQKPTPLYVPTFAETYLASTDAEKGEEYRDNSRQEDINASMKILWDMLVGNRGAFLDCMRYIENPYSVDVNDKLKVTEATLMGLQLNMNHFYAGFVKDKHSFLSVQEVSNKLTAKL